MHVLLIITGGIAAYKTPELVRRLREQGMRVTCVVTQAAQQFVTPLALSAVSEAPVYDDLWDLRDERDMGHIRLSREADTILIAPASADFIAKVALGLADDLGSALLLAADKPALFAPAMNHRMWHNPATQRNVERLRQDGHTLIDPDVGDMACGEFGPGRLPEISELVAAVSAHASPRAPKPLAGTHALITSGPTVEALDPVRYVSNHSSGKQGWAIAQALIQAGAKVTLISGPTHLPRLSDPNGSVQVDVTSADSMLAAAEAALPASILIAVAAVADYRPQTVADQKMKKQAGPLTLELVPTRDILTTLCQHANRPQLTVGFAAETGDLHAKASAKRAKKGCDWLLANDVGANPHIFGGDQNQILFLSEGDPEYWPLQSKSAVAQTLVRRLVAHFA